MSTVGDGAVNWLHRRETPVSRDDLIRRAASWELGLAQAGVLVSDAQYQNYLASLVRDQEQIRGNYRQTQNEALRWTRRYVRAMRR